MRKRLVEQAPAVQVQVQVPEPARLLEPALPRPAWLALLREWV
ncbi:MAG: hypothetical protein VYC93_08925 [Pseudomonadota bacterium]|nr:hypothetical protein [Pseudomonadota bacterium]